ncbi:FMN-binding protein [Methylophilaceae bacterium]|nr:FMN-binding protein [Methylophilaceae bacterium]
MFTIIAISIFPLSLFAKGVYQTEEAFLNEVFKGEVPSSQNITLRSNLRKPIEKILGHPFAGFRIKYWKDKTQTAWILKEIGKVEYITFGIAIKDGEVSTANVLEFKESRGWEIRYPAFTSQYIGARLIKSDKLTNKIDGISGATLSLWAMNKIVKIALKLDEKIQNEKR